MNVGLELCQMFTDCQTKPWDFGCEFIIYNR